MSRKILIVHTGKFSPFAARDAEILQRRYNAKTFGFLSLHDLPALRRKMGEADVVLFWFVGRAAIWGMILPPRHPKIVSIIGGYEAAWVPEIKYGYGGSPLRRRIVRSICKRSDRIIAVSQYSQNEIHTNLGLGPKRVSLIYNAVDTAYFSPGAADRESAVILTVCHVSKAMSPRKGIDVLIATAQQLPECRFLIAGPMADARATSFAARVPRNVGFTGRLSPDALRALYQSTPVYFQPSRHEAFGVAVAEAMACGCVPVVSPYGALPEVVGDAGYILERLEPEHAAAVLRQALQAPVTARGQARARIVECFDIRHRAEKLHQLIDELLQEE